MAKASRKLLLAFLAIALCLALLVVGTYALFSRVYTATNHLVAGNLNVTLTRTNLVTHTLNGNGQIVKNENTDTVDFSKETNGNIFDIKDGDVAAPGCNYTAQLELANEGTVAFTYWIQIILKDDPHGEEAANLASQLQITVTVGQTEEAGDKTGPQVLSEGLDVGSESKGIGVVEKDGKAVFFVRVEFIDDDANNTAMDQHVQFDLVVHAVQYVEQTQP